MGELPEDSRSFSDVTRRGILAAVGTGATTGLAGCGGDGNGGGEDVPEEVEQTIEEEVPDDQGGQGNSLIPGELVSDQLDGVDTLNHWAETEEGLDWIKLEVQNNREKPLQKPGIGNSENAKTPIIRGRTVTDQGNVLAMKRWDRGIASGPDEIKPDTSAEIGFEIDVSDDNAAKYELCQYFREDATSDDWKRQCTDWTPTPTPTARGPGSNDVVHNSRDDIEVVRHELTDGVSVKWVVLEIELRNTGEQEYYFSRNQYRLHNRPFIPVLVQWYNEDGRYSVEGVREVHAGQDETVKPGETITLTDRVQAERVDTYEICIIETVPEDELKEVYTEQCGWPR